MTITEQAKSVNPTTILTGFLGAGKTTYLNHLLERYAKTKFAIIENEFGEQSIDSDLILRSEDSIVELNNGCLCCTLNSNLYEILNTLHAKRNEFSELIIEATGVADPKGLAAPFFTNPAIKKQFPLRRVICLVDALLIEEQLTNTEEALHQITFSDVLLINKTDLVDKSHLEQLAKKLKQLNPLAKIVLGNQQHFPIVEIESRHAPLEAIKLKEVTGEQFPVQKPDSHHHHNHTEGIVSHTLFFDRPFDDKKLHLRLLAFLMFQAKGLYRMKGLIWLDGSDEQYILQSVGSQLAIDFKRKWLADEKKQSKIVMIGKNFKKQSLQKMFTQCLISKSVINEY